MHNRLPSWERLIEHVGLEEVHLRRSLVYDGVFQRGKKRPQEDRVLSFVAISFSGLVGLLTTLCGAPRNKGGLENPCDRVKVKDFMWYLFPDHFANVATIRINMDLQSQRLYRVNNGYNQVQGILVKNNRNLH